MPAPIALLMLGAAVAPKVGDWFIRKGTALVETHLPAAKEGLAGIDIWDFVPFGKSISEAEKAPEAMKEAKKAAAKAAKAAAKEAAEDMAAAKRDARNKATIAALKAEMVAKERAAADRLRLEREHSRMVKLKAEERTRTYQRQLSACKSQLANVNAYSRFAQTASAPEAPPQAAALYETVNESVASGGEWPDAGVYGLPDPTPPPGVMAQVSAAFDPTPYISPSWGGDGGMFDE